MCLDKETCYGLYPVAIPTLRDSDTVALIVLLLSAVNSFAQDQPTIAKDSVHVNAFTLGDQDGTWDKAAWKTEAFYGNPLTGFTPVP